MNTLNTIKIAERAFDKHLRVKGLKNYPGILSLDGLARLYEWTGKTEYLDIFRKEIMPFVKGEIPDFMGAYTLYNIGGAPSSLLLRLGKLPEAEAPVKREAEKLVSTCTRSKEGIFSSQTWKPRVPNKVWIDVAFAICPFLCNAGRFFENENWINEAAEQIIKLKNLLIDQDNGLYHQSRGFCGKFPDENPDKLSEDHWSRGNGWGIFALAELVLDLPEKHPLRPQIEKQLLGLIDACLKFQDENGMWHQEITAFDSFVETSGTGLILYAIGVALEKKIAGDDKKDAFLKGLKGYTSYIGLDGSVHNCCSGCLCPGQGTIEEYKQKEYPMNDHHGFGPVMLAFGQAAKIGIKEIKI